MKKATKCLTATRNGIITSLAMNASTLNIHEAAELEALEFFEECQRNAAATASNGLAAQKFSSFMTNKHHERLAALREKAKAGQSQLAIAA